jgi:hypothetical protein
MASRPQRATPTGARSASAPLTERELALVAQVAAGTQVALLDASPTVSAALRDAGCNVLEMSSAEDDATWRDELDRFDPTKIVLADAGRLGPRLPSSIATLVRLAPTAELVIGFWNATGASSLLDALLGAYTTHEAAPEDAVRSALTAAGLSIASRASWSRTEEPQLAQDVARGLRRVFAQLNPAANADWVTFVARRTPNPPPQAVTMRPGLLSVIIRNHSLDRLGLLDEALFSLACQEHAPLEIVLVTQCTDLDAVAKLTAMLERHQHVNGYTFQVISRPSSEDIRGRLLNIGVEHAQGEYLAFLDDDDVVYPEHYRKLIAALRDGTAAWAVARTRAVWFTTDVSGELYCKRKSDFDAHQAFSLSDLVRENYIPAHAYVLDRARLGRFPVRFAEEVNRCEDYVFLLRLAACFRPVFLGGAPTCEYRMRDDGSNSNLMAEQPEEVRAREQLAWQTAQAAKDAMKRNMHMLVSITDFERDLQAARPGEFRWISGPLPFRYRIVDKLNETWKRFMPVSHARVKATVGKLTTWSWRRT